MKVLTIIRGLPGSGKCHGVDTPIMMYDGSFKMVQDIKVGDQLMGPDSKPRNVLNTCIGYGELFKVKPIKGESFVVNKDHILNLHLSGKPVSNRNKVQTVYLENGSKVVYGDKYNISINEYLSCKKIAVRYRSKLWSPDGIEFTNKTNLKIDPYILGLWLGDGTSKEVSLTTMDNILLEKWKNYFESNDYGISIANPNKTAPLYRVTKRVRNNTIYNKHKFVFESYDLINNKHIPVDYLNSCKADRLKLLAGLIDSDGYVGSGCCEIVQKSNRLSEGIVYLARSLGFKTTFKKINKSIKSTSFTGEYNKISISGDISIIPVELDRKKGKPRKQIKNVLHTGFEIEKLNDGKFYGFELDGDHLYLATKDLFVNHNSTLAKHLVISGLCDYNFEADMYFRVDDEYRFDASLLGKAHDWCRNSVEDVIKSGLNPVVSNTFTTKEEIDPYLVLAKDNNYIVNIIECKGDFGSIHSVPEETIEKMKRRWVDIHL